MKKYKIVCILIAVSLLLLLAFKIIDKSHVEKNDFSWSVPLTTRNTDDLIILNTVDSIYNDMGEDITYHSKFLVREVKNSRVYKLNKGVYRVILREPLPESELTLNIVEK